MAFLIIAGVTYQVQPQGTVGNGPERIGQVRRTFNGTARSSVRAEKESFTVALAPIDTGAYSTLRSAIALGVPVTCSGDFLGGGSNTFWVTITSANFFKPTQAAGMYRVVTLELNQA